MTASNITPALAGLRVLDLSRVLAGPWATQTLADLGAEVIKIEKPGQGDDTRQWGPPWLKDANGTDTEESAYFLSANRNKKSVTIDMAVPLGQQLIRELAAQSDILVENFKVGGLAKYGLEYQSLKAVNPRLIYCSITGFGQDGPDAMRPGYDFMIQGMSGLMSVTGAPVTDPGSEPQKIGVALVDVMTGLYAAIAILAAVEQRHTTSLGQHIDLALFDCAVATLANQALNFLVSGEAPQRLGNAHPNIVPYQAFATADGHIILAVGNDGQFQRFCRAAGITSLASNQWFATNAGRVANRHELLPIISSAMLQRTTAHWMTDLQLAGVPCGPINSIEQAFAEPQAKARNLTQNLHHASGVQAPSVRSPLRLQGDANGSDTAPPLLGQHTHSILSGTLGKSSAEISSLRTCGII